ncbi:DgyrCDS11344 [Dimorphilus gyrociliatus]|uniref:Eukaryotic translation initiation factor 3 subunit K n=1 Tax=Dimorphilus gyrociliatus TaxID=2664684 RepID=A0A7I8W306_9ANNE|nr:DgyrCDS11344 [Dimorphilus gyrociliatus]
MADTAEGMRVQVSKLLKGIERYNPENLQTLEKYVNIQAEENTYDLEANLAVLKLYQFNPSNFSLPICCTILLKALTNLPHSDFTLCKCLIHHDNMADKSIEKILYLSQLLETCEFKQVWPELEDVQDLISSITGFEDSIRKFVCHAVNITFQTIPKRELSELLGSLSDADLAKWIKKYNWSEQADGYISIGSQDDVIKTKNITEKITFESVATIMGLNQR